MVASHAEIIKLTSLVLLIPQFCPRRPGTVPGGTVLVELAICWLNAAVNSCSARIWGILLALPPPLPCRTEILLFLEIFFRSLPCQGSNRPAIVGISRFPGRYAEKCRKTKASIVRLGAVRAHSVKIGPDMHCCRTARPMRDLHSLPFHYRSGAMRTELGDQQ